jgi:hypothetical protein
VGVNDRIRWEVQWHPAGGARIRRLVFTSRGARRLLFSLGVVGWIVVAGALWAGLDVLLTRFAVDAARRENRALRAQQEVLREQAGDLAGRVLEAVERGRRMARVVDPSGRAWEGQGLRLPARGVGDEAFRAWLGEQDEWLERLGNELAAGRVDIGVKQASVRAPARTGTAPVRNAAVFQVADVRPARPQEVAPARR